MNRITLQGRINEFLEKVKDQHSIRGNQKDECLNLWAELKHHKTYCQVCSTVVTRAWTELKEWHEQNKNL